MELIKKLHNGTHDITMIGPFTFNDHITFREVLDSMETPDVQHIVFHMSQVDFIDSAGLGMLLLALDESTKQQKTLRSCGHSFKP